MNAIVVPIQRKLCFAFRSDASLVKASGLCQHVRLDRNALTFEEVFVLDLVSFTVCV